MESDTWRFARLKRYVWLIYCNIHLSWNSLISILSFWKKKKKNHQEIHFSYLIPAVALVASISYLLLLLLFLFLHRKLLCNILQNFSFFFFFNSYSYSWIIIMTLLLHMQVFLIWIFIYQDNSASMFLAHIASHVLFNSGRNLQLN